MDPSGIYFQTQKCMQNTSWEQTGVPEQRRRTYRTRQNSRSSPEPLEWEPWPQDPRLPEKQPSVSSVQSLSHVRSLAPHELQHARPPCLSPTPGVYSNSCLSSRWCHPAISSSAAAAKSLQSCLTLCDPTDGSPPGSAIPGILQARTLEWVAISFSDTWKWKVKVKSFSCVWLFVTPWTLRSIKSWELTQRKPLE